MRRTRAGRLRDLGEQTLVKAIAAAGIRTIEPCAVFIGMSGMSLAVARTARERYGASIWIERGSQHVLSQRRILAAIPGNATRGPVLTRFAIEQELADYAAADRVTVPTACARQSFLDNGFDPAKLFVNPYGVDLQMFPPTEAPPPEPPIILTVGAWSRRKGCDVLLQAWRTLKGVRLLHVGPVLDLALPADPDFEHHDAVPQSQLTEFYKRGHVFALASREEGLAVVQAQSLASGLRLVCTSRTGGEDLKEFLPDPSWITVVPPDDSQALAHALRNALNAARQQGSAIRDSAGACRENLSWRAYARRYSGELQRTAALSS